MSALRKGIEASAMETIAGTGPETGARRYRFGPGFIGFSGHFPGNPVLPAIVQIRAVVSLAEEEGGKTLRLAAVRSAKFLAPIRPDEDVWIRVSSARRFRDGHLRRHALGRRENGRRLPTRTGGGRDSPMITPYFTTEEGAPAPLRAAVSGRVRFEEVDPLGIVWHGRYASYFEDARVALTDQYGIGYLDFYEKGIVAPIRKLHVDYFRSLRFRETFTVEAVLHWTEAPA